MQCLLCSSRNETTVKTEAGSEDDIFYYRHTHIHAHTHSVYTVQTAYNRQDHRLLSAIVWVG